jgi:hypothetical protein
VLKLSESELLKCYKLLSETAYAPSSEFLALFLKPFSKKTERHVALQLAAKAPPGDILLQSQLLFLLQERNDPLMDVEVGFFVFFYCFFIPRNS